MRNRDFQNMFHQLTEKADHGNLMLLTAPTGIGKSYSVAEFICRLAKRQPDFHTFFVTDQKKNLGEETLKQAWVKCHKNENPERFYRQVAIVRSLLDTVTLLLKSKNRADNSVRNIPEILLADCKLTDAIAVLAREKDKYDILQRLNPNRQVDRKELATAEYQVRLVLIKRLGVLARTETKTKMGRDKIRRYVRNGRGEACEWLNWLYPTIDLPHKSVYVLTTDKFIRSYTDFFRQKGSNFQFADFFKGSLVIFDEFENTKTRLLNETIDNMLEKKTDLIGLFQSLRRGLVSLDEGRQPSSLRDCLSNKNLHKLIEAATQINQQYHLNYHYRNIALDHQDCFIFHARMQGAISNKTWYGHFNAEENFVELKNHGNKNEYLYHVLAQITWFVRQVSQLVATAADRYADRYNQRITDVEAGMDPLMATQTIYDALGLTPDQTDVLLAIWEDLGGRHNQSKNKSPVNPRPFQDFGLDIYYFEDALQHDLRTDIDVAFFKVTPEKYLLHLLSRANVLGLSATATSETVLDNFDLAYLRAELGTKFQLGQNYLTAETKEEMRRDLRYDGKKVKVTAECAFDLNRDILKLLEAKLDQTAFENLDKQKVAALQNYISEECSALEPDKQDYCWQRYLQLFDSFVTFLQDAHLTSFLGFQWQLPSRDPGSTMSAPFIADVYQRLRSLLGVSEKQLPELRMISSKLSQDSIEVQVENALALPSSQNQRVYLLSAYQTLGVGQNLQHVIGDFEREWLINVSPERSSKQDKRNLTVDIGGIYLGDVTHRIAHVKNVGLNRDSLLRVIQLNYLCDAHEITQLTVDSQLRGLVSDDSIRNPQVKSIFASVTRTIVQALGRLSRTYNKVPQIKIIATATVLSNIYEECLQEGMNSPEMQALLLAKNKLAKNDYPISREGEQAKQFQNYTGYTKIELNSLLVGLRTDTHKAQAYRDLRDFTLRHPTASVELLERQRTKQLQGLYYLPIGEKANSYTVYKTEQGDWTFSPKEGVSSQVISAEASGLFAMLRYPGVRALFEREGYATSWEPAAYQLNPVHFVNLYLGALGEVVGKFILEDIWQETLLPLETLANNELFDFKTATDIVVDFKNWRGMKSISEEKAYQQNMKKLATLNENTGRVWRALIINIVEIDSQQDFAIRLDKQHKLMEVPALIDGQGHRALRPEDLKRVGDFLIGK